MGINYYTPQFKWQLVQWLNMRYPGVNFNSKSKTQLYAIYHSVIKRSLSYGKV